MDKIDEIIAKVDAMPAMVKFQMYHAAQRENERQKEENKIGELFNDKYNRIIEITKIKDNMFVIEYEDKSFKEKHFTPIVNNKNLHECFPDFDSALLAAISIEHTGETNAGYWAAKLMVKEEKQCQKLKSKLNLNMKSIRKVGQRNMPMSKCFRATLI